MVASLQFQPREMGVSQQEVCTVLFSVDKAMSLTVYIHHRCCAWLWLPNFIPWYHVFIKNLWNFVQREDLVLNSLRLHCLFLGD